MTKKSPFLLVLLLSLAQTIMVRNGFTQSGIFPLTGNVLKAYASQTRNRSGAPGKYYWQNTGDYTIRVDLDPKTRTIKGSVAIDYSNNSPDTLKSLLFKLYPNLYKNNAMRNMPVAAEDLTSGVQIRSIQIEGRPIDSTKYNIRGTNMYLRSSRVVPGQKIHIDISYAYSINKGSFIRTGQIDSGAFFIAYFFPRLAVYDDIDGWNEYPYIGKEEFYNDFCNFHTEITLPGNYLVWATGELKNTEEVYNPLYIQRIEQARAKDSITDIISAKDLAGGGITRANPSNTWKFDAANVTDFAFAISNHYIWRASSLVVDSLTGRRTEVDAVFNPDHKAYLPVLSYNRATVALISHRFPAIPFPYSHETIFEGLDAMEYPMMVNNLPFEAPKDAIAFSAHEVFHSIFPFYVGTNETKNSFMDEGWATLAEFMFPPLIDSSIALDYDLGPINSTAGAEEDMPLMTPTPQLYGKARYADKDLKPALANLYLKEYLGDKLFGKALQAYIGSWAGKHPSPYDFFYSMNTASGIDLDWFWKNWFFEKNIPDLAIGQVIRHRNDYTVTIRSPGNLFVPIHLVIVYRDGSRQTLIRNIGCWSRGQKSVPLSFKARMPVRELILGNAFDADIHPENNHWLAPAHP